MAAGRSTVAATHPTKAHPSVNYRLYPHPLDDPTWLAYTEILDDERAVTAAAFRTRAEAGFADRGIRCERALTDNGSCYRSRWGKKLLSTGMTDKRTRPYRPQTNGKFERFHRILLEEWAYIRPWCSERQRHQRLPPGSSTSTISTAPTAPSDGQPRRGPQHTHGQPPRRTGVTTGDVVPPRRSGDLAHASRIADVRSTSETTAARVAAGAEVVHGDTRARCPDGTIESLMVTLVTGAVIPASTPSADRSCGPALPPTAPLVSPAEPIANRRTYEEDAHRGSSSSSPHSDWPCVWRR